MTRIRVVGRRVHQPCGCVADDLQYHVLCNTHESEWRVFHDAARARTSVGESVLPAGQMQGAAASTGAPVAADD